MSLAGWIPRPRPGQGALTGHTAQLAPLVDTGQYSALYNSITRPEHIAAWHSMPPGPFASPDAFETAIRDWPAIERRLTGWLDLDNFDETGSQKQRLEDF